MSLYDILPYMTEDIERLDTEVSAAVYEAVEEDRKTHLKNYLTEIKDDNEDKLLDLRSRYQKHSQEIEDIKKRMQDIRDTILYHEGRQKQLLEVLEFINSTENIINNTENRSVQ